MIIYHPAYDAYHGALRIVSLCDSFEEGLEIEKVQLLDFYIIFPEHFYKVRLPNNFRKMKSYSKKMDSRYKNSQEQKTLFFSYVKVSKVSFGILLAKDIICSDHYEKGVVKIKINEEFERLKVLSERFKNRNANYFKSIVEMGKVIPLYGNDGLKHRTGLLEYRYDVL